MATVPVTAVLILAQLLYLRGWLLLSRTSPQTIPIWRAMFFSCGLISVWLAAASPLAMLDEELLTAHMVQHLLLMTIGPAFILLGFPSLVLLGTNGRIPDLADPKAPRRNRFQILANPLFCWFAAVAVLIGWHIPAAFALGFRSGMWHHVEQATFLAAGFLFWSPVIPARPGEAHAQWSVVIYLFMGTLPCDALSAFLAFCGRVVYPVYLEVPRHFALSALQDQECAGALMWTCVTIAYLIPAVLVTLRLLSSAPPTALLAALQEQELARRIPPTASSESRAIDPDAALRGHP
jgi:cytochrome c oxidase assembly factor CtaG